MIILYLFIFLNYVFTVAFVWQFQKYNPGQSAKHPLPHGGYLCKNTIDRFRSASAHAKRGKHLTFIIDESKTTTNGNIVSCLCYYTDGIDGGFPPRIAPRVH